MPLLILVRGVPGSGKSTFAKHWVNSAAPKGQEILHFEADQYFVDSEGNYNFDPSLLPYAHQECYTNTLKGLASGKDVIVSNTFVRSWEMQKYLNLPKELPNLNIDVLVVEMHNEFESVHGVPKEKIKQMKARFDELPKHLVKMTATEKEWFIYDHDGKSYNGKFTLQVLEK